MYTLCVMGIGAAGAWGCMGSDETNMDIAPLDPERAWQPPALVVGWELQSDRMLGCDEIGAVTTRVVAMSVTGRRFEDLFFCQDGAGISDPLPLGRYDAWVEILDPGGVLLAQSSVASVVLDQPGEVVPVDFHFPIDGGYLSATWSLRDEIGNRALSCADVEGDRISILVTRLGTGLGADYVFDCEANAGFTRKLPLGAYTVEIALLDRRGRVIATATPLEVYIDWGNQLVDLGNFDFSA